MQIKWNKWCDCNWLLWYDNCVGAVGRTALFICVSILEALKGSNMKKHSREKEYYETRPKLTLEQLNIFARSFLQKTEIRSCSHNLFFLRIFASWARSALYTLCRTYCRGIQQYVRRKVCIKSIQVHDDWEYDKGTEQYQYPHIISWLYSQQGMKTNSYIIRGTICWNIFICSR